MCLFRKCQLMRSRQKRRLLFVNAFAEHSEVTVLVESITKQMVFYGQTLIIYFNVPGVVFQMISPQWNHRKRIHHPSIFSKQ